MNTNEDIAPGQEYGYLTVEREVQSTHNDGRRWLCKCKCGNTRVVNGYRLRKGIVWICGRSCKFHNWRPPAKDGFGGLMYNLRKKRGMTVTSLAEITGLSMSYLLILEGGKAKCPSLSVAQRIANALGKKVSVFEDEQLRKKIRRRFDKKKKNAKVV